MGERHGGRAYLTTNIPHTAQQTIQIRNVLPPVASKFRLHWREHGAPWLHLMQIRGRINVVDGNVGRSELRQVCTRDELDVVFQRPRTSTYYRLERWQ